MERHRSLEDLKANRSLSVVAAAFLTALSVPAMLTAYQLFVTSSGTGLPRLTGRVAIALILVPVGAALLWGRVVRFQRAITVWPVPTGDDEVDDRVESGPVL
jgi:hypothetical protein